MRRSRSFFCLLLLAGAGPAAAGEPLAALLRPPGSRPAGRVDELAAVRVSAATPAPASSASGSIRALIRTTAGDIACELDADFAPNSVAAFVGLATGQREWIDPASGAPTTRPLYDGTVIHRVIPGFLIQGGDPTGTGTGGPGYSLPDEIGANSVFDRAGILALANRGPNTNGSQFFITDGPAHHLDGRYTRLGACRDLSVISRIAALPRGERNRPVVPVVIRAVVVGVPPQG